MTNQEAIEELKARKEHYEMGDGCEFLVEALEKGIEALENQKSIIEELENLKEDMWKTEPNGVSFELKYNISKLIDRRIFKLKGE